MSETTVIVDEGARRIMLVGPIERDAAATVISAMTRMNDVQPANNGRVARKRAAEQSAIPIELWIDSPGGLATGGWAIVDVMRHLIDTDVVTVGMGSISSAAVLPLLFGSSRLVLPHAEAMVHGVSRDPMTITGPGDTRHHDRLRFEMETDRKALEWANGELIEALVERAGWTRSHATAVVLSGDDHRFFGGAAIVAAGLADAVLGLPTEAK